jgi:predicted Ser/Thr protein kinase
VARPWHATSVDYLELTIGRKLRTGIYEAISSVFGEATIVAKFTRFPWEIGYMENETWAYEWINGHDIGPRFLGHLTENFRVIGLLLERITGARHAGAADVDICKGVLSRLHGLGVQHGDTNRFNFLVSGETAVLIDFDTAKKCDDAQLLRQELEDVPARLSDVSSRGGGGLL